MSFERSGKMRGGSRGHAPKGGERAVLPGRNPVRELLRNSPQSIKTLYVATGSGESREREALLNQARSCGVPIATVSVQQLDELAAGALHQSFVAEISPRQPLQLSELLKAAEERERSLLLFLDNIQDPHNLGAIFRAAECFGVAGIVWSRNRGVGITPVVRKVAVGATELVPHALVGNLAESLRKVRDVGFWVATAELSETSVQLSTFEPPQKIALVLGSEGEGVQNLVSSMADYRLQIPMSGVIDSLNVSQATAVLLYGLTQGGFTRADS